MDTDTDTDADFRATLGHALRVAREAKGDSVHAAAAAGLGYRVIGRLERGANEQVELSALYLLALYYGVDLRRLVSLPLGKAPRRKDLGTWEPVRSLPDLDGAIRETFRQRRLSESLGTPTVAGVARVHQSWLALWELGVLARCDLVRVRRCALVIGTCLADLIPPTMSPARVETA